MSDKNVQAELTAKAILALIDAANPDGPKHDNPMAALFADVGPSDDFMATELVSAGVTQEDLDRVKGRIEDAVQNGDVLALNKILKGGAQALGFLKDVLV